MPDTSNAADGAEELCKIDEVRSTYLRACSLPTLSAVLVLEKDEAVRDASDAAGSECNCVCAACLKLRLQLERSVWSRITVSQSWLRANIVQVVCHT